jgi:hypothetical protein
VLKVREHAPQTIFLQLPGVERLPVNLKGGEYLLSQVWIFRPLQQVRRGYIQNHLINFDMPIPPLMDLVGCDECFQEGLHVVIHYLRSVE